MFAAMVVAGKRRPGSPCLAHRRYWQSHSLKPTRTARKELNAAQQEYRTPGLPVDGAADKDKRRKD